MIIRVLFAVAAAALPVSSGAVDIASYEKIKRENLLLAKTLAVGIGEGFAWSNTELEHRGDKPLFCVPRRLALYSQNYMHLLDVEVKENPVVKPDSDVAMVLLQALKHQFPCK